MTTRFLRPLFLTLVLSLGAFGCGGEEPTTQASAATGGMGGGMMMGGMAGGGMAGGGMGMMPGGEPLEGHVHGSMDGLGNMHGMAGGMMGMMAGATGPWTVQGTIEAFDEQGRYVSIAHEEIPGYMMAMTMPFFPGEEGQLEGLEVGQRVEITMHRNEEGRHVIDAITQVTTDTEAADTEAAEAE